MKRTETVTKNTSPGLSSTSQSVFALLQHRYKFGMETKKKSLFSLFLVHFRMMLSAFQKAYFLLSLMCVYVSFFSLSLFLFLACWFFNSSIIVFPFFFIDMNTNYASIFYFRLSFFSFVYLSTRIFQYEP